MELSAGETKFLLLCGPDVAAEQLLTHAGSSNSGMVSLGRGGASFGRQLVRTGWGWGGFRTGGLCTGNKSEYQNEAPKDLGPGAVKRRWIHARPWAQTFLEFQQVTGV